MKCPFGNSNSHASSSSKPSLRQIAFDGALSTFGNACMKRCLSSRLASATACEVAAPLLCPEADRANAGAARHVDDLEHAISAIEALIAILTLAQLVRTFRAAEVLGHAWIAHQPLEQGQVTA